MPKLIASLVTVIVLASAPSVSLGEPPADATPPGRAFYVAARGGLLLPQHVDVERFDTGSEFAVAGGWRPKDSFALELGLGRTASSMSDSDGTVRYDVDLVRYPVSLTAKFITSAGPVSFYSLIGLAVSYLSVEARTSVSGVTIAENGDSGKATSFHFGAGGLVPISDRVGVGAELRYVIGDTKEVSRDLAFHLDHITLGAAVVITP
jgi:opacity protein-like surface antigen